MAESLGYASVSKMLGEVTSEELSEWSAYFKVKEQKQKENASAQEAKDKAQRQGR